jgi:hypothetical protein
MHRPHRAVSAVGLRVAVIALTLLAATTATPAAARAAKAPAASRCPTSRLVIWLDTQGNGAAGSVYYGLELTNLSGRSCTLAGYPRVSAVTLAGRRLGSTASRNAARPVRTVRLAPGSTATAVLQIVEARNFPRSACRPTTAAGLRVYAPNRPGSKLVPFPFLACARSGPVYLTVEALRRR